MLLRTVRGTPGLKGEVIPRTALVASAGTGPERHTPTSAGTRRPLHALRRAGLETWFQDATWTHTALEEILAGGQPRLSCGPGQPSPPGTLVSSEHGRCPRRLLENTPDVSRKTPQVS